MNQNSKTDTRDLAKEAVRSATNLLGAELAHAKDELTRDAKEAAGAAVYLLGAAGAAFFGVELVVLGLAGVSRHPARSTGIGLLLLGGAAIAGAFGIRALPKKPLSHTTDRLASDAQAVREELAR